MRLKKRKKWIFDWELDLSNIWKPSTNSKHLQAALHNSINPTLLWKLTKPHPNNTSMLLLGQKFSTSCCSACSITVLIKLNRHSPKVIALATNEKCNLLANLIRSVQLQSWTGFPNNFLETAISCHFKSCCDSQLSQSWSELKFHYKQERCNLGLGWVH